MERSLILLRVAPHRQLKIRIGFVIFSNLFRCWYKQLKVLSLCLLNSCFNKLDLSRVTRSMGFIWCAREKNCPILIIIKVQRTANKINLQVLLTIIRNSNNFQNRSLKNIKISYYTCHLILNGPLY